MFNGYKILVATWKSSRDVLYNTVRGVSRTEWTHQSLRGKAGVNFLHLHLEAHLSQIPLELGMACRYHQGLPAEGRRPPELGVSGEGEGFILRL